MTSCSVALALASLVLAVGCGRAPAPGADQSHPPSTTAAATSTLLTTTSTRLAPTTTPTTVRATTTTRPDPCANADIEAGTRLKSGVNVERGRTGGISQLRVENGSALDATVKVVGGGTLVRHIFVRSSESATADSIPPGSYRLLVSQGKIWKPDEQEFQCNRQAFEFVEGAVFSESTTSYSVLSITLQPTPDGEAPTRSIGFDAFNQAGS